MIKCLEQKNEECQTVSDMLFMLMSLQNRQNILRLYQDYKLIDNDFLLCENISKWMENQSIPRSDEHHILYNLNLVPNFTPIPPKERTVQKKLCLDENHERQFVQIEISSFKFAENGFVASKGYKSEGREYRAYVFKQDKLIHCFVE